MLEEFINRGFAAQKTHQMFFLSRYAGGIQKHNNLPGQENHII